jgi:hypothetical protein
VFFAETTARMLAAPLCAVKARLLLLRARLRVLTRLRLRRSCRIFFWRTS